MKDKCFSAFEKQVNRILAKYARLYSVNNYVFEKKVAEHKANCCGWGCHDEFHYLQEFTNLLNKSVDDIFEEINNLLQTLGRKLTKDQCETISDKCIREFERYIDNYKKKFEEVMGNTNQTQETSFVLLKSNTSTKINEYFDFLYFVSYNKLDKAYITAIISILIAGVSALIPLVRAVLNFI